MGTVGKLTASGCSSTPAQATVQSLHPWAGRTAVKSPCAAMTDAATKSVATSPQVPSKELKNKELECASTGKTEEAEKVYASPIETRFLGTVVLSTAPLSHSNEWEKQRNEQTSSGRAH